LKNFTQRFLFIGITLSVFAFAISTAQAQKSVKMSRGVAPLVKTINFTELAAYEAAHPTPEPRKLIMHENEGSIPEGVENDNSPVYFDTAPWEDVRGVRALSPPPVHNFAGLNDINQGIPPDVGGCVGPNHYMEVLNTQVRIYNKAGTSISTTSLNGFWTGVGTSTFDPHIVYDQYAGRWIFVTDANPSASSAILIGVSVTSDPTGSWHLYAIDVDATNANWLDFPLVGFNNKWICVSGNMFSNTSGNSTGIQVYAIDKASVYAGGPANFQRFTSPSPAFTYCPAKTMSALQDTMFLAQTYSSTVLHIYRITGAVGSAIFATHGSVSSSSWGCTGCSGNFAPQLNTDSLLDAGDWRMESCVYSNNSIWCAHNAFLPASGRTRSIVQWWQLSTAATPVVIQKGRVEDPSSNIFYSYPCIAVNSAGDALVSYTRTARNEFPSVEYSLRYSTDALNTMRSGYRYKLGEAWYGKDYGSGRIRWGDYTSACLDPVDSTTFWCVSEYAKSPTSTWATWIAEIKPERTSYVDFKADTNVICNGASVQFTDISTNSPTSWAWTFTGGTPATSTAQNPSVTYSSTGVKNVMLIVNGTDTMIKNNYILVVAAPVATVNVSGPTTFCAGGSVNISASVTGTSWQWNNGDTTRTITVTTSGTYYAIVTNAVGCSVTSNSTTVTVVICTDVAPIDASYSLSVNPNPAHNSIDVNFIPREITGVSVDIMNDIGQKVFEKNIGRTSAYKETIDVSTLPRGIYFLNINTDKEKATTKVVIE